MGSIIRYSTVFYPLLYLNSRPGFCGLKYLYSVIAIKIESLLKIPCTGRALKCILETHTHVTQSRHSSHSIAVCHGHLSQSFSVGPAWSSPAQDLHGFGRHASSIPSPSPSLGPWRARHLDHADVDSHLVGLNSDFYRLCSSLYGLDTFSGG